MSWASAPVRVYRVISAALPPRCRFYPTCSAYSLQAIQTHGAVRGWLLTLHRIVRCHPFHPGGYDPVPQSERCKKPEHKRVHAHVDGHDQCAEHSNSGDIAWIST